MMIDTAKGPIDDSRLAKCIEETELPGGTLVSTKYFLGEELVKLDQNMKVSEEALVAAGFANPLQ